MKVNNISSEMWIGLGTVFIRKEDLKKVFNVEKGSVYNQSLIDDRLNGSAGAQDAVSNLISG